MIRLGLVDLDTSHPRTWLPILRSDPRFEVRAVYDGGTVWDPGYAQEFAQSNEIPHVAETLEEMAELVDAVIIHSCNWDIHLSRAEPFVKAGKKIFLDKPVVGSSQDARKLREWVADGADIIGGSALRYAREVTAFNEEVPYEAVNALFATCPTDVFNYGIHGYELVFGLMGPGVERVRYLGGRPGPLVQLSYADGREAILELRSPARFHFTATVKEGGVKSSDVATKGLYDPLIEHMLDHFAGKKPFPYEIDGILEPVLAALAVKRSEETGAAESVQSITDFEVAYDGNAFAEEYRAQRRK